MNRSSFRRITGLSFGELKNHKIDTVSDARELATKIIKDLTIIKENARYHSFNSVYGSGRIFKKSIEISDKLDLESGSKRKKLQKKLNSKKSGVVYLMKFDFEDRFIYKIGLTTRRAEERLMEILLSFHLVYGYCPKAKVVSVICAEDISSLEKNLLEYARNNSEVNITSSDIDGCSEFMYPKFDIEGWFLSKG